MSLSKKETESAKRAIFGYQTAVSCYGAMALDMYRKGMPPREIQDRITAYLEHELATRPAPLRTKEMVKLAHDAALKHVMENLL